jgi:voltage-gated potassium channel
MPHLSDRVIAVLDRRSMAFPARAYRLAEAILIIAGVVAMMVNTLPDATSWHHQVCSMVLITILSLFILDLALRVWLAPALAQRPGDAPHAALRWRSIRSISGILDLLSVVPIALTAPFYWTPDGTPLLACLWLLRLARYSSGPHMLITVLVRERAAILGLLLLFVFVLVLASILAFLAENKAQPDAFGSVFDTLWWTITTLTTTGYGDRVPVTGLGKVLGGGVMIGGIVLFALLAGLLATSFAAEVRRRDFLQSWDMLVRVPFFQEAGPATIADLAAILRPRDLPARASVTRRGQPGDCMFFIVSGEVEILLDPRSVRLGPGQFFGEIALLTGGPRNATAITTRATQLLVLDIADFRSLAASRPELTELIKREANRRLGQVAAASGRPVSETA